MEQSNHVRRSNGITHPGHTLGTGTLGRHVVRRLRDAGYNMRVLSWHSHESGDGIEFMTGDLAIGEGIRRDGRVGDPKIGTRKAPWGR